MHDTSAVNSKLCNRVGVLQQKGTAWHSSIMAFKVQTMSRQGQWAVTNFLGPNTLTSMLLWHTPPRERSQQAHEGYHHVASCPSVVPAELQWCSGTRDPSVDVSTGCLPQYPGGVLLTASTPSPKIIHEQVSFEQASE